MKQENNDFSMVARPAQRALAQAGYTRLEQFTKVSEAELSQLHGVGTKALAKLREALKAKGWAFAKASGAGKIKAGKMASPVSTTARVDAFIENLDHPFKAEVQALRKIFMGVNKNIAEEIKWKAPSFSYKGEYLVTFNLWTKDRIHLVFHNSAIPNIKSELLEGDYKDRRMVYISGMKAVKAKKAELEKIMKALVKVIDKL